MQRGPKALVFFMDFVFIPRRAREIMKFIKTQTELMILKKGVESEGVPVQYTHLKMNIIYFAF